MGAHHSSEKETLPFSDRDLDAPPPYSFAPLATTSNTDIAPRPRPRRRSIARQHSPLEQLKRYLIEIVTYTLDVDFGLVCQAIGQDEPGTTNAEGKATSILMDDEKEELFRLATTTLDLYRRYMTNQWNLTLDCDRATILTSIIAPARSLFINEDYILDMISTYAEHQCDPLRRKYTLLSRYTPQWQRGSLEKSKKLEGTLVAHARMISIIAPNESSRLVLGHALACLQERFGIRDLKAEGTDRWLLESPCRSYMWQMCETLDEDSRRYA